MRSYGPTVLFVVLIDCSVQGSWHDLRYQFLNQPLQGVRRHGSAVLLDLVIFIDHGVQGSWHGLRHQLFAQPLQGVRCCRWPLLCEQHLHCRRDDVQELPVRGLRRAWHVELAVERHPVLPRQRV